MRHAIEDRHRVFKNGPPANPEPWAPGGAEFEKLYERFREEPRQ
jgi:hypothetical protein